MFKDDVRIVGILFDIQSVTGHLDIVNRVVMQIYSGQNFSENKEYQYSYQDSEYFLSGTLDFHPFIALELLENPMKT